jgi:spore coat polysaccharide biosynthesis protein SpsF
MKKNLRVNASIEARLTSSRLPGKVLMPAGGKPLLQILVERLRKASLVDDVIVATTINKEDDPIVELCQKLQVKYFRGSENNVLERVVGAHKENKTDVIVEITGDCPLMDPQLVNTMVQNFLDQFPKHRYITNTGHSPTVPSGFDVQVFTFEDLSEILKTASDYEKEHVSARFYNPDFATLYNPYSVYGSKETQRPELWVTLDYKEDYLLIKKCYEDLMMNENFGIRNKAEYYKFFAKYFEISYIDTYTPDYLKNLWTRDFQMLEGGFPFSHILLKGIKIS